MENTVRIPQGTLHYAESGPTRPNPHPVVFVHGLLNDRRHWDKVAHDLSNTHRCIAPTWPMGSHPEPMAADAQLDPLGMAKVVADTLRTLDLNHVILVGNDSGGAITQLVAAHHPERLAGVVLTNCDALEVFPPPGFEYLALVPRVPGLAWAMSRMLYRYPRLQRMKMAFGDLTHQPIDSALLQHWLEPAATQAGVRRDMCKLIRGVSNRLTLDAARRLATTRLPVRFAWGADDRYFTVELATRLAAMLPDAKVTPIDRAKTYVALERPDQVAAVIRELTTELATRTSNRQPANALGSA
ncbi:MAG: alpha/beta hydrolase [Polyangiaceae bacterium]